MEPKVCGFNSVEGICSCYSTWAYRSAKKKNLINMNIEVDQYNKYPVVQFKYTSEQGLIYEIDSDARFM